jgi:methanogenic corrinoid protein MtbC1
MSDLLERLALCVEKGKVDRDSTYPPDMKGQDGASELCRQALDAGMPPDQVLKGGLVVGMRRIGDAFGAGKAFIPQILIAAKAMNAAMAHLKPCFLSGEVTHRGTVVLGTVAGDLHDIGKNIVRMILEGDGWKTVDLGVDVGPEMFLAALDEAPDGIVAMSALLTTTMANMKATIDAIRERHGATRVFVGGAPVTAEFAEMIGADGYFPDPHSFARSLEV